MKFYINNTEFKAHSWTDDSPMLVLPNQKIKTNWRFHIRIGFRNNPSVVKGFLNSLSKSNPLTVTIIGRRGIKYYDVIYTGCSEAAGACVLYFCSPLKYKILWRGRRKWPTTEMFKTLIFENDNE